MQNISKLKYTETGDCFTGKFLTGPTNHQCKSFNSIKLSTQVRKKIKIILRKTQHHYCEYC